MNQIRSSDQVSERELKKLMYHRKLESELDPSYIELVRLRVWNANFVA